MASLGNCRRLLGTLRSANRTLALHQSRAALATTSATEKLDSKVKVTLIPGDGVGPELCFAVKEVFQAMSVPVHFEELFLSEVNPNMSVSVDTVIDSIKRNGIALKGILSTPFSSSNGELETLNMKIRKQLDLFANVVHIKSMEGKQFCIFASIKIEHILINIRLILHLFRTKASLLDTITLTSSRFESKPKASIRRWSINLYQV